MTLNLALSTGKPVKSGATTATNGPDITAGRCTTHGWRDPHWTKEFKLTYWGVLLCYIGFFLTTIFYPLKYVVVLFCVVIEVYYHGLGWPPAPKTSAACLVAVDFQLAHPNSSLLLLLLLLLHLLGAVLAVASIC